MSAEAAAAVATARALLDAAGVDAETVARDALALCAIPAPTFEEGPRRDAVAALTGGGTVDGTGNLLVRLGPETGTPAVLAAHLDTVFPAGTPIEPSRDGDVLRGPGIGDNALAVAALVAVVRALRAGPPPALPLVAAFTTGEEGAGNLVGATEAVRALAPRAFIAVEGHFLDRQSAAAVGSVRLRAEFRAPGGHSWGDRGAANAVHAALRAGAVVADLRRGPLAAVSVGVMGGGTGVNVIAAEAHLLIDIRAVDPAELRHLEAETRLALEGAAVGEGTGLRVGDLGRRPGGALPPGHPLPEALAAVRHAAGLPPADPEPVSTDANAALGAGVPAAVLGVSRGGGMHTTSEWVAVPPIADGLVLLTAAAVLLGSSLGMNSRS